MNMRSYRSRTSLLPAVLLASAALVFGGCGSDDKIVRDDAELRVIHLSPDAPEVDVYVDGAASGIEDLGFQAGTASVPIAAGTYSFQLAVAGTVPDPEDLISLLEGEALEPGLSYTVVAYDTLENITGLALVDDFSDPGAGNIRVRAIHTAVGVGVVDIWEVSDPADPLLLYEDVDFGAVGGYYDLPAGSYTLGFDVTGDALPDLLFETGAIPAGSVINIFAVSEGEDVFLLAQFQDDAVVRIDPVPPPQIRVIHLSPDAPEVDVYVDGAASGIEDLGFQAGTASVPIAAGTYSFQLAVAGTVPDPEDLISLLEGEALEPGLSYTVVAYDTLENITGLALVDDFSDPGAGNIRVRAIHTAVGVGVVDIWEVSDPADPLPLYEDVDFGAVGGYYDLPVGSYTLGFDVTGDAVPDLLFETPDLPEGSVINIFAVSDGPDVFLLAQFQDDAVVRIDP